MTQPQLTDKQAARHSFERAAATYDRAAVLQNEVLKRMFERLEYIKYQPKLIADVGAGTGNALGYLHKRYPQSEVIALDFAFNMLGQASNKVPLHRRILPQLFKPKAHFVCADMENIPLRASSVDMIWSNLAFQWSGQLEQTLKEAQRILSVDGLLMFSTFGPDTLKELNQAFAGTDRYSHVNRFVDMHDIGDMLVHAGFADPVIDMECITMTYADLKDLMMDLKLIGAHNVTQGRQRGLTGKDIWQQMQINYEQLRVAGKLPATFEIIYGHAWKPQARVAAEGYQIIKLDSLKRSIKKSDERK
jgi:malonyl-CoA O-methyltransferase